MLNSETQIPNIKIALAHDSFTQLGGAERVVEAFHELFPHAPIFTLVLDRKLKDKYKDWDIRTSWLQVVYNFIPKLQYLLPLIPLATSSLDFSGYDVVLSSSSSFIKNIKVPKSTKHICYCHTPTRFLWSEPEYVKQEAPRLLLPLVKLILFWMKKWDLNGSKRVKVFIANSLEVKKRIFEYYQRNSEVIYPFVDTKFWQSTKTKADFFLLVGRLQPHKNNEFVIKIFNDLGKKLHVVGTGRQEEYLKSIAHGNIKFLGRLSDSELRNEYSEAKAIIYPQVEDFGLVPLEGALCGTPTIAFAKGGALETVVSGVTGEFFSSHNSNELFQILQNFKGSKYLNTNLVNRASEFSKEVFVKKILNLVNA